MSPPPLNYTIGPQFSGDFFLVVTLLNNNRHNRFRRLYSCSFHLHGPWALYVALSSLTLPLRQPIQTFTTNQALSGPPLHRDRTLFHRGPQVGGFGVVCAGSGSIK